MLKECVMKFRCVLLLFCVHFLYAKDQSTKDADAFTSCANAISANYSYKHSSYRDAITTLKSCKTKTLTKCNIAFKKLKDRVLQEKINNCVRETLQN